jgi:hypothetical protein
MCHKIQVPCTTNSKARATIWLSFLLSTSVGFKERGSRTKYRHTRSAAVTRCSRSTRENFWDVYRIFGFDEWGLTVNKLMTGIVSRRQEQKKVLNSSSRKDVSFFSSSPAIQLNLLAI